MRSLLYLATLLGLSSAGSVQRRQSTTACNNSPDLCSKPYNSIVHLGAHDSPFVRDATTGDSTSGNQFYNSTVQLDAGVRLLSAQVHHSNGDWHLCHSSCDLLDAGLLSDWLVEIKDWLDSNLDEVVTVLLVNSDNATPDDLAGQFAESKITKYAYIPPDKSSPPQTWPTLQELIVARTRLMVFVASLDPTTIGSGQEYLMDEFTFIFENPFSNTAFTDFTCTPNRPTAVQNDTQAAISSNRMALMNHFLDTSGILDIQTPDVANISITNAPGQALGNFGKSASDCKIAYGKNPTFTLVDFFDQGPAIQTVDSLNGVTNPVGRKSPPKKNSESSRATSTFRGVAELNQEVKNGQKPKLGAWIWAAGEWSWGGINLSGSQAGSVLS